MSIGTVTISAATFLHLYIAANSGPDHIRLFGHRHRVGFPAAHRSIRDWAYGPGTLAKSACTKQTMSRFACCPTKGPERPERGSRPGTRSSMISARIASVS